jgi:periplasmic copper chaperone A
MQWFAGSRSDDRSVLIHTFQRRTEASVVFGRTARVAAATSAARIARTSDSILTWAPPALIVGRTKQSAAGHSTLVRRVQMHPIVFFFTAAFGFAVTAASAADYKAGSLDISDPWSRATPKGSSVAAGYMTIKNNGSTPDRLISGSADVASKFEVHEMKMEGSVAKMRPVKGGLEIKPGETVELKPGSFHVMFGGLKKPLSAGDHFKATLEFEKAGSVSIDYDVRAIGAERGGSMPGMKKHGH